MSDDREAPKDPGDPLRDGVRSIAGILGALKEAIEDTFDELRQSGELSPERARDAARSTFRKAQDTMDDVRGRFEFVARRDFDALRQEVDQLRARLDALEKRGPAGTSGPPPTSTDAAPQARPAAETATGPAETSDPGRKPADPAGENTPGDSRYRFEAE